MVAPALVEYVQAVQAHQFALDNQGRDQVLDNALALSRVDDHFLPVTVERDQPVAGIAGLARGQPVAVMAVAAQRAQQVVDPADRADPVDPVDPVVVAVGPDKRVAHLVAAEQRAARVIVSRNREKLGVKRSITYAHPHLVVP